MKEQFTIDDAIGQCEATAAALERECQNPDSNWCKYASIAAEKRQLAEWLRELKKLKSEDTVNREEDCISRAAVLEKKELVELEDGQSFYCINPKEVETLPPVIPQQTKWIPCSEKQPDKTGQYLVTIKYRHDEKGYKYMTVRRNYFAECQTWDDSLVIAWQPLPEPYQGERREE